MTVLAVSVVQDADHPIAVYMGPAFGTQRLTRDQAETLRRQLDVALKTASAIVPEKGAA